jgi:peptidase M23-like protein
MLATLTCAILVMIAARPSPVEIVTPKPPTPVMADGKRLLVYEFHISNLGRAPLQLKKIEVAPLHVEFAGDALAKMLRVIGGAKEGNAAYLDVGRRATAFMWIAVPPDAEMPRELKHRLTFDIADATEEPKESAIDGIVVPVLRNAPPVLNSPFSGGDWLAGSGPSNTSDHRRAVIALDGRIWLSQRFAIDFVKVGANGDTWHVSRDRNENFWAFGQPVHAVADGEVTEVVDVYADNTPGQLPPVTIENITGNHVIIRIADGMYTTFAHLRRGSVRVKAHQRVKRGDVIAEVGNSGNTTGAHLHFQVTDAGSPLASEGIPYVFDHFTFLGNGADFDESHHPSIPRHDELPLENIVLRFTSAASAN